MCLAIWIVLQPKVMLTLTTATWKVIADGFANQWQFLLCTGAIDVKYILMQAPSNSGSMYFNYKRNYSMVLMVVDTDYHICKLRF